jgi:uncharacterized membrane protein SpoIIM required for sporulation
MNEVTFVEKREKDWRRLTLLSDKADTSPSNLSREELQEFVRLYRSTSGDLALVRTQSSNLQLIDFLNDLVGRAYMALYRPKRGSFWKACGAAVTAYASTVRKLRVFVYISLIVFFLGAFGSYGLMTANPELRAFFVPPQLERAYSDWKYGTMQEQGGLEGIMATSFYSANNPLVAIRTGARAVGTLGILGIESLWETGAMVGSLAYETAEVNRLGYLLIRITPHGVTEISGLIFAASGGLSMGWALVSPGRRKRGEALLAAAKDGLIVYIGGVFLMFIAAPIEGFFSFNPRVPEVAKIIFASVSLAAWLTFYIGYGKQNDPA